MVAITNTAGVVVERLAYDPWGKRRFASGTNTGKADTLDAITGQTIDRGFTMHEHIDEMGIINMNGRIYDPLIGRFMSADPYIQAPYNLKSFNRYICVWNNSLRLVDLNGYNASDTTTGSVIPNDPYAPGGTTPSSCFVGCSPGGNGPGVIPNSPNPPGYVPQKPPANTPVGAGSAATQNPNPPAVAPPTVPEKVIEAIKVAGDVAIKTVNKAISFVDGGNGAKFTAALTSGDYGNAGIFLVVGDIEGAATLLTV